VQEYVQYRNESELITAFREGDPAAANAIFIRHFRPVCLFVERFTHSVEAAEDVVADTFIKLLERKDRFISLDGIRAFLYTAARNAAINRFQADRRHTAAHRQLEYLLNQDTENEEMLQEEIVRMEVLAAIYREVEYLPGKCREIFKYIFFEGLSSEDIAGRMGIAVQTVRNQKARAIQLLKVQLLKKGHLAAMMYLAAFFSSHQ